MSTIRATLLISLALIATSGTAQQAPLPPVIPANRPSIGLALQGGGALGLAHIGVIQWFEDHHIPIDRIAGTSMGALVGASYASGHTPAQMRALATSSDFTGVFTLQVSYVDSSFRRRQDRRETPSALSVGLARGRPALPNSILTDRGINEFLTSNLIGYNSDTVDYNRLPVPFRCVATDLNTLTTHVFASGPLPNAVRASISIPGIFPPVRNSDGHYLSDGGILDNLPTGAVRNELHADIVIAVHLDSGQPEGIDVSSILAVLNRAFDAGIEENVGRSLKLADQQISIPVDKYSGTDYTKGGQLIREGYLAAEAAKARLLPYALGDADWSAYLTARESRRLPQPGVLRQVHVDGGEAGAKQQVLASFKPIEGQPIDPASTLKALKPVQSEGVYSATYQTFGPPAANTPAPQPTAPDNGILVHLHKEPGIPPYLLIAPDLAAETSDITRMQLNLRLVWQDLGGYGSELRANGNLGFMTALNVEYYRLLSPGGFYIQPHAGALRQPVYIWANQQRIAERLLQNLDAGVEAGRTIRNNLQISAGWRVLDTHWGLSVGSGGGPSVSGAAQEGLFKLILDKETSNAVSPSGFRLNLAAGGLYHAVSSANAPVVMASAARTWLWKGSNIFSLTGDVNSYLRGNVAEPFRFTLGGPHQLSASATDEYRGTDTWLARAAYLHRIAPLPTGLGQGIYTIVGYEAGEIWSPESRAILRQDAAAGLLAITPLGSISVGGAAGDAAHRKFFFTIGRLF